jgi:hypothetical protein
MEEGIAVDAAGNIYTAEATTEGRDEIRQVVAQPGTSGVNPLRLQVIVIDPVIDLVIEPVLAILLFRLFHARRPFFALLATVAHHFSCL